MIEIREFQGKKLVEYLRPGLRVRLLFAHGLGDTVLFLPVYNALKALYLDVYWALKTYNGQEELFDDGDVTGPVDYEFTIDFPCGEHIPGMTKPRMCCEQELGIDYDAVVPDTYPPILACRSPLVGVHFNSTCFPAQSIPIQAAKSIWEGVLAAGCVPIEVHFEHKYHNKKNYKYPFVDATVRGCQPRISALTGLLQRCGAFIGCNSGPYWLASAIGIPTLFVHTVYPLHSYIRGSADIIKKEDVTAEKIRDWVIKAYSNGRTI